MESEIEIYTAIVDWIKSSIRNSLKVIGSLKKNWRKPENTTVEIVL